MDQNPMIVPPGGGTAYPTMGGDVVYLKAGVGQTAGVCSIFETATPTGGGPPPHLHAREVEAFYVLEGEFLFRLGERQVRAPAGTFLTAPPGVSHSFRNVGGGTGRLLVVAWPGGLEHFFAELVALSRDGAPDLGRLAAVAHRYGLAFA